MSMEFVEKNKAVLGLAGVTIVGAAIFAATTPAKVNEPQPQAITVEQETAAPEPQAPVTSFADMIGDYQAEAGPPDDIWGEETGGSEPAPAQVTEPTRAGRRPNQASRSQAPNSTGIAPPAEAKVPAPFQKGQKVSRADLLNR